MVSCSKRRFFFQFRTLAIEVINVRDMSFVSSSVTRELNKAI